MEKTLHSKAEQEAAIAMYEIATIIDTMDSHKQEYVEIKKGMLVSWENALLDAHKQMAGLNE